MKKKNIKIALLSKRINDLCKIKDNNFECIKPILAFTKENFNGNLNNLNEKTKTYIRQFIQKN